MDPRAFELNVAIPGERRYARTIGALAKHAAKYAGIAERDASHFGSVVERVVDACVREGDGATVPVIIRRSGGPVEFLIQTDRNVGLTRGEDRQVTGRWVTERGRKMLCLSSVY